MNTRLKVYQACVASIHLYGSETWTTYARQEVKLNSFYLHCLRRILDITTRQEFQTPLCWRRPNSQVYMLYSAKDVLDGWVTYAGWEKEGFQRTSSKANLKNVHVKLAAHSFASKMFASGNDVCSHWHRKLGAYGWRSLHMAAPRKKRESSMQRIHETFDNWRREISEMTWARWSYLIQFSNVKDVIKTVIQISVFF